MRSGSCFDRFEELLHPDVEFGGMTSFELQGAGPVAEGYRRLGPVIVRNQIRELVVDGDTAFVLYDFVTDTAAGAVLSGELLKFQDGRVLHTLLFDWLRGRRSYRRWSAAPRSPQRPMPETPIEGSFT